MSVEINTHGQPIGVSVPAHRAASRNFSEQLSGRYGELRKLCATQHAQDLYQAYGGDNGAAVWTYMPYGPFVSLRDYEIFLQDFTTHPSLVCYAICDKQGYPLGVATYLNLKPEQASVEVGHLCYSPALQGTSLATEAMYLMAKQAFARGYRRYEWKCNALNAPSMRAAMRLGFQYEGTHRQAAVIKGHNRDTAWYSMLDSEWPNNQRAFERWLVASNFDQTGQQKQSLSAIRRELSD